MNQVVHVEGSTSAPRERVFELIAEVEQWPSWAAFDEAALEREGASDRQGVGAIRRFRAGRARTREEIVAFERPGHFAYVLLSGIPIRDYRADVTLTERSDGGTDISWHSTFRSKVPGLGGVVRRSLTKFITGLVADLTKAAEMQRA